MFFDTQNLLSNRQAITVSAPSTNVLDLGPLATPHGANAPVRKLRNVLPLVAHVSTTFAAADAAALDIEIQNSDDPAFGSYDIIQKTPAPIAKAALVAGYRPPIFAIGSGASKRYVRAYYTVATGPFTAGALMLGVAEAE